MKYENIEMEVVLFENDDILTLSVQDSGSGAQAEWDKLDWGSWSN